MNLQVSLMEQQTILISIAFAVVGLLVGVPLYMLSKHLVKVRDAKFPMLRNDYPVDLLNKRSSFIVFEICIAFIYGVTYFVHHNNCMSITFTLILASCCMVISAVDLAIRMVPNEMLLVILLAGLANDIINPLVYGGRVGEKLLLSVLGIVVSFFIFYIPKMFGLYMGNGDIKLSATIGFALGLVGYIQAMVVMALVSLVLLVILLATKKGGMKTKTPMGPALSIGAVVTALYMIPQLLNVQIFK